MLPRPTWSATLIPSAATSMKASSVRRSPPRLRRRGGLLLTDEAFMDVAAEGISVADQVGRGNIVVLRSFGKFYGLPGVRLSFALATPEIASRLAAALGPWPVSSAA